jgi:hypothetical protein
MSNFGGSHLMDELLGGFVLNAIYQFQTGEFHAKCGSLPINLSIIFPAYTVDGLGRPQLRGATEELPMRVRFEPTAFPSGPYIYVT